MSIQDKINRLQTAKTDIAGAITAKGGTVAEGDGFEEFSNDISSIPEGITVNESYDVSEGTLNSATFTLEGTVVAIIPSGVTTIGASSFTGNYFITSVIIPDSVITIANGTPFGGPYRGAFYGCTRLTSITIPNSVTSIGGGAFYSCTSLLSITIPNSVTSIGYYVFGNCTSLLSITIGNNITSIGNRAFIGCTGLTSITILDSVTSIGEGAFYNCTSLTDIYYTGTQAEWEQITIGTDAIPETATIHYEYTP